MNHATETPNTSTHGPRAAEPRTAALLLPTLLTLTLTFLAASAFVACGAAESPEQQEMATETAPAGAADSAVAYEPAYPDEVSDEELSEEDVEQAAAGEHTHADGETHSHDDGDSDDHDDEGGDHDHGDDGHQH